MRSQTKLPARRETAKEKHMKKIMVIALSALLGAGFVSTIPAQRGSRGGGASSQLPNADVSGSAGYEYGYKFGSGNFTTGEKPTELSEADINGFFDIVKSEGHAGRYFKESVKNGFRDAKNGKTYNTAYSLYEAWKKETGKNSGNSSQATEANSSFFITGRLIRNSAMALVQGGNIKGKGAEFGEMGLIDEGANIAPYYIGKYEVTQEFYAAVIGSQKNTFDKEPSGNRKDTLVKGETQERRPVDGVTWYDALNFCNILSKAEGLQEAYTIKVKKEESGHIMDADVTWNKKANGFRLPSEEEWELACRGGDPAKKDFAYSFSGASSPSYDGKAATSADLDKVGWYAYNPSGKTSSTKGEKGVPGFCSHEVGKKGANAIGAYDMSGNVYEWVYDVGDDNERIIRGGAYTTSAAACKITAYNDEPPSKKLTGLGFRIARNAK